MRRKDREITDRADLINALRSAKILTLALWDGAEPYAVPVNFGYSEGRIFFHCATEGRKLDIIAGNPTVAFVAVAALEIKDSDRACGYTTDFISVMGTGTARVVRNDDEKRAGLGVLMAQHGGPAGPFEEKALAKTAIVEISVASLTGKKKGFQPLSV